MVARFMWKKISQENLFYWLALVPGKRNEMLVTVQFVRSRRDSRARAGYREGYWLVAGAGRQPSKKFPEETPLKKLKNAGMQLAFNEYVDNVSLVMRFKEAWDATRP